MKTFKQFTLDEGWKDYLPSMDDVYATGLNFADTATMGGYKYARAGVDYAAKNALKLVGKGKGTTYDRELKQEKEKLTKAEKHSPKASAIGDIAGYGAVTVAPQLPLVGAAATNALKANEIGTKAGSMYKSLRTIIGR
jgi:hypothetical protein